VLRAGEPWLLEARGGGPAAGAPRLRRYAARVRSSGAREIVVRALRPPLAPAAAAALRDFAEAAAGAGDAPAAAADAGAANAASLFSARAAAGALAEAARAAALGANASVELVAAAAAAAGLARPPGAPPLALRDLAPPAQPWAAGAHRYAAPVWVRDVR
jgi:hypothetical protein